MPRLSSFARLLVTLSALMSGVSAVKDFFFATLNGTKHYVLSVGSKLVFSDDIIQYAKELINSSACGVVAELPGQIGKTILNFCFRGYGSPPAQGYDYAAHLEIVDNMNTSSQITTPLHCFVEKIKELASCTEDPVPLNPIHLLYFSLGIALLGSAMFSLFYEFSCRDSEHRYYSTCISRKKRLRQRQQNLESINSPLLSGASSSYFTMGPSSKEILEIKEGGEENLLNKKRQFTKLFTSRCNFFCCRAFRRRRKFIDELSDDILNELLAYLSFSDFLALRGTCMRLHALVNKQESYRQKMTQSSLKLIDHLTYKIEASYDKQGMTCSESFSLINNAILILGSLFFLVLGLRSILDPRAKNTYIDTGPYVNHTCSEFGGFFDCRKNATEKCLEILSCYSGYSFLESGALFGVAMLCCLMKLIHGKRQGSAKDFFLGKKDAKLLVALARNFDGKEPRALWSGKTYINANATRGETLRKQLENVSEFLKLDLAHK